MVLFIFIPYSICIVIHSIIIFNYITGMLKITTVTRDGLAVRIKPDFVIPHKVWFHLVMNYKDEEVS